jgi:hypothetical protein
LPRHVGLLALVALPALGCAKGEEIAPGEVVIFTLDTDAGADAGRSLPSSDRAASATAGAGGTGGMVSSPAAMAAGQPAGTGGSSAPSDGGTNDAGQSEDRPVDAGD